MGKSSFCNKPAQIKLGRYRQEVIQRKQFNKFFEKNPFYQIPFRSKQIRDNYFKQTNRLSQLSKNVSQIKLVHSSIEELKAKTKFSLAYLSNVTITPNIVTSLSSLLVQDAKISFCILAIDKKRFQIPNSWELDVNKTQRAYEANRKKNFWYHIVCRYKG